MFTSSNVQGQHRLSQEQRVDAVSRADAAEAALREERLRSSLNATKWQDQLQR